MLDANVLSRCVLSVFWMGDTIIYSLFSDERLVTVCIRCCRLYDSTSKILEKRCMVSSSEGTLISSTVKVSNGLLIAVISASG